MTVLQSDHYFTLWHNEILKAM